MTTPRDDPDNPEFWESRYKEGDTGWDIGQAAPPFVDLLARPDAPAPGTMLVLGSGRGHDAIYFARHSFKVVGVDFAPEAISYARRAAEREGVKVVFVEGDLFELDDAYSHRFDYVLEHTCFSAIPLHRREEYARLVKRLLAPGGLFIALFFAHGRPGGPPFGTDERQVRELFGPHFAIEKLERPSRSVEQRQGAELFALMRPVLHGGET
jgi:methyl halide transferase